MFISLATIFPIISLGQFTIQNLQCRSSGYADDYYLAYCGSKKYGDYEHAALYYGLEHGAQERIRNAQVIFLGDSRTQAAFSTEAVKDYFDHRNIPFYVLGFGYSEHSEFPLAILKKVGASPKVLVINATPFFSEKVSEPGRETLDGRLQTLWKITLKKFFQPVHRTICSRLPWTCLESEITIFRSAKDGRWNFSVTLLNEPLDASIAIDRAAQKIVPPKAMSKATAAGKKFLSELAIARHCVILTGTEDSTVDGPAVAATLAASLRTSSLFPNVDDITTVDTVHFNVPSAERWSAQFVKLATPILEKCGVKKSIHRARN